MRSRRKKALTGSLRSKRGRVLARKRDLSLMSTKFTKTPIITLEAHSQLGRVCVCLCVFAFVYLCVCICVSVFAFVYLCVFAYVCLHLCYSVSASVSAFLCLFVAFLKVGLSVFLLSLSLLLSVNLSLLNHFEFLLGWI